MKKVFDIRFVCRRTFRLACCLVLFSSLVASCAVVTETYINTEVMDKNSYCLETEGKDVAFFGVYESEDSVLVSKIIQHTANFYEKERGLDSGSVKAYTIPFDEFKGFSDTLYMESLMVESASELMVFITDLNLFQYKIDPNFTGTNNTIVVDLPYALTVSCYDGIRDTLLHNKRVNDLITASTKTANIPVGALAREIGKRTVSQVAGKWVEVTWPLMWYPDDPMWIQIVKTAREFKFQEAIKEWMKYYAEPENHSEKAKEKCACAAHNIAVCCELSGERELAKEWAKYAVAMCPTLDAAKRLVRRLTYLEKN